MELISDLALNKVGSLNSLQHSILKCLSEGKSKYGISRDLKITEESALAEVSKIFSHLEVDTVVSLEQRRKRAVELYQEFIAEGGELPPPYENIVARTGSTIRKILNDVAVQPTEEELERIIVALSNLGPQLQKIAECMYRDVEASATARELSISESSVPAYISNMYSKLRLPLSLGVKQRRNIFKLAYSQYKAGEVPMLEKVATPIRGPLAPSVNRSTPLNGHVEPAPLVPVSEMVAKVPEEKLSDQVFESPRPEPKELAPAADQAVPHYGPGVPIILSDPATILDVSVVSDRHHDGAFDKSVAEGRHKGFNPEILVVYPTTDPKVTHAQLILVKRKPAL